MKIFKLPVIETVKAMPEYNLVAVDFYPFQEQRCLEDLEIKVNRNLDTKNDINQLISEYKGLANSVLIPDGRGNLYRWFFKDQDSMLTFLNDKQQQKVNTN